MDRQKNAISPSPNANHIPVSAINDYAVIVMGAVILDAVLGH